MNDNPDNATLPAPDEDAATPPGRTARPGPGIAPLLLSGLALLLVIGALVGGYFIWHEVTRQAQWQQAVLGQIDSRNQVLEQRLKSFNDRLAAELAAERRERDSLRGKMQDLLSTQSGLEQTLELLRSQVGRSQDDWVLGEVGYLLQIANQRLQLQRDPDTALAALAAADQRLLSLGKAAYLPVRREIAAEVAALRGVQMPDISGLSLQLQQLASGVEELRLQGSQYVPAHPGEPAQAGEDWRPKSWRDIPAALMRLFREVFVVQPVDKPVGPMLPPDERFFLYANLRLQLEAARAALLEQQPGAYRSSLESVGKWLSDYFDTDQAATRALLDSVQGLAGIDIKPKLPDISGSLQTLREEIRLRGDTTPAGATSTDEQGDTVTAPDPLPADRAGPTANQTDEAPPATDSGP